MKRRAPAAAGFDPAGLEEAIRYAQQNEAPWERDVFKQIQKDVANEPYPAILGETSERGGPAGMIVRHGYLVAQWGDIDRVDMSFSVAKSYLSTVAGLAVDAGLIADVKDRVAEYVQDGGFDGSRNREVTWHMLLNQTSEWEGTLWDKPDVADRRKGYDRKLQAPGTFWEYNDVRVNRLALALLRVTDGVLQGRRIESRRCRRAVLPMGAGEIDRVGDCGQRHRHEYRRARCPQKRALDRASGD